MLEIKKKKPTEITEIKNAFDGPISRWDMAEEKNSELQDKTVENSKMEKKRERRQKKKLEYSATER